MATSFPKLSAPPTIQLLVLVLILGAGLFPKNTLAQAETAANPDAGLAPSADDDTIATDAETTAGPALGRAGKLSVKCWKQDCHGSAACLNGPTEPAATIQHCPDGYCFDDLVNVKKEFIQVSRRCATAQEVTCLQKEPGNCYKLDLTEDFEKDSTTFHNSAYMNCLGLLGQGSSAIRSTGAGKREMCLCDSELCNGGPPGVSGSTRMKHLGLHVGLVGALLLVAVFPLQTMSLVG